MFLVNSVHRALEAAEEGLRTEECGGKVDCVGEFIDYIIYRISKVENANRVSQTQYVPYFSTSSKCFRCFIITSRCFSRIASAMKR